MKIVLKKISEFKWEIPKSYKKGMRVPGIVYANEKLLKQIKEDESLEQVANAAFLPGIVKASLAMPDIHYGYGLPIGGVVATDIENGGVITPGGVGYDINCGVRVARTNLLKDDIYEDKLMRELINTLYKAIPTGVGSEGRISLSKSEEKEVLIYGAKWAIKHGYGKKEDLERIEANGCLKGADPEKVSKKAYERGMNQIGTLGSGNHFLEIQYVDEIYDIEIAEKLGLKHGTITIMIHSGSRGFGHQICTDYIVIMNRALSKFKFNLPDRQLVCAPYDSEEGQSYLAAMKCAANYAFCNRQCLMFWAKEAIKKVLRVKEEELKVELIYDVAHNIVKIEKHIVNGEKKLLAVHRKGATRAFPKGHEELPKIYKDIGQPVLIPGDMGRYSYILIGTEKAMEETFGSSCHGAGRVLSRNKAKEKARGRSIKQELLDMGIYLKAADKATEKEEMPEAYKDVSEVVKVVVGAGLAKKIVRLKPIGVIKG